MQKIIFKYEGLEADKHFIDAGKLGQSLVGISKITSYGLIALLEHRTPKRGEKSPLSIVAGQPKEGSVEVMTAFLAASWTLPVGPAMFSELVQDLAQQWIGWVLNMVGGRESEAKQCFDKLIDLTQKIQDDNIRHKQLDHDFLLQVIEKLRPAAKDMVAPVGPSCDSLTIMGDDAVKTVEIDAVMADAIRSKDKLEVSDMEQMKIQVDGFTHHNRQIKIEDPDNPGRYISAIVRDPAFEVKPNAYTEAAVSSVPLMVNAKRTTKDGKLVKLYIMDTVSG